MELLFGTHVRSGGRRLGSLAGLEVDAASRTVTKIIFSNDGKLGGHAHTRPLPAIRQDGRTLSLGDAASGPTAGQPMLLSRSVPLVRDGRQIGRVAGADAGEAGAIQAVLSKAHWWSKRVRHSTGDLDFSIPGEIRVSKAHSATV